jgi:hypothetical protein
MDAWVDERDRVVRSGGEEWRFTLDLRAGSAAITVRGIPYRVTPLRWIEKRRLARLAHLGESFVTEQFWHLCVSPGDRKLAVEPLALARWLSSGGLEAHALPLDSSLLARVTAQTCRALGVAPTALDDLEACEVETLWRQNQGDPDGATGEPMSAQSGLTRKIVIVPEGEMQAQDSAARPAPDQRSEAPVSAIIAEQVGKAVLVAAADVAGPSPAAARAKAQVEQQPALGKVQFPHSTDFSNDTPPLGPPRPFPVAGQRPRWNPITLGAATIEDFKQNREPSPRSGAKARPRSGHRFKVARETVPATPALDVPVEEDVAPSESGRVARDIGEETAGYFGPFRWHVNQLRRDLNEASGFAPRGLSPSQPLEFAEEFAERLRLAAADLGIGEEA